MAVSLPAIPSSFALETATVIKLSSVSSLRLGFQPLNPCQISLRATRSVTSATASKPATDSGKREPRGIMKPRRVSPEMQAFLGGVAEIPRTQALKLIWSHIKEHNLQDPQNKKIIVCDDKLKSIFGGRDRVGFLEIAGLISPHFLK